MKGKKLNAHLLPLLVLLEISSSQTDKIKITKRPGSRVFHLGISELLFLYVELQSLCSKQGKLLNQISS